MRYHKRVLRPMQEILRGLTKTDGRVSVLAACIAASRVIGDLRQHLKTLQNLALRQVVADPLAEVGNAVRTLQSRLDREGIELSGIELTGGAGALVFMESAMLRRCVLEVLTNAVDACRDSASPRIGIRMACKDEKVIIRLSDNGKGIRPERWGSVFNGDSDKVPPGGTGLQTARRLVTSHSGKILLKESIPWETTVFEIELHRVPS
jgi:C4-dicarboxylate-specific signal transduction histidine kinase